MLDEGQVRIAIIDDSESMLSLLCNLVVPMVGRDAVFSFKNPVAALSWCQDNDVDLILVDYVMPNMSGLEFIEAFRRLPGGGDVPIVMITTVDMKEVRYQALQQGATDFLNKPFDQVELVARMRNLLALSRQHRQTLDHAARLALAVDQATRDIVERERESILVLSRAAEFRDNETGAHLQRMSHYCRLIATRLGLPAAEVEQVFLAAPMHDVGKIGIPDHVLLKPGPLTKEEWAFMATHPVIGRNILRNSKSSLLRVAADIAVSHHEKWDGTGYPYRLAGPAIPLVGRITAVADVYDALTSHRPYKPAWTVDRTLDHMRRERGSHFDPDCLDAFLDSIEAVQAVAEHCAKDCPDPIPPA